MNPKTMTRIEAACWAAGRVFIYSASSYLVGTFAVAGVNGANHVPDLQQAKAWGFGALVAGGAALVAFVKNAAAPRSQIVKGS